jgi:hypothetical protein
MPSSITARPARWLLALPLAFFACDDHEAILGLAAATSGGGGYGTSTSVSGSGGGAGSTGGHGGASSSTTASTSATASGSGGSGGTGSASGGAGTGGAGGATTSSSSGTGGALTGTRVRVVAANVSTGNNQNYDGGEGLRILQGIHGDVVLIQEMNYGDNSTAKLRALTDQACGTDCGYTRGTGAIPNGVLSRYPIVDAGTWTDAIVSNRDFVWAHIDVPGPVDLWVVSVHLLTSGASQRDTEAGEINALLDANVPPGDFVVVGGDFNTANTTEPALTTFQAWVSTTPPYPVDGNGNGNTNGPRSRPHDWVLPSPALRAREAPVLIGAAHFDTGLVVDTRVYTPIADLAPALVGDSGANGMQHMAVVRDFLLE